MEDLHAAIRHFRSHTEALLGVDGDVRPTKYVIDPKTGRAVVPATADVFGAEELMLFVPDDAARALQLLCEVKELDRRTDAACDRYLIYHGPPEAKGRETRWAMLRAHSAKFEGALLDELSKDGGDEFAARNKLATSEPSLVKALNSRPAVVVAAIAASLRLTTEKPTVVGVDQGGFDVRARFGVLRVGFPREAENADEAVLIVGEMARLRSQSGDEETLA